jgi:hypothetical protein
MPLIGFDMNTASQLAAIAASLAALASSVSVIISVKSLNRTTKQTDILTKQFELAELARKESARPRLTAAISKYQPPEVGQLRGDVSFTLRNAGHVGFQVVSVRTQSGNTQNQDVTCSIEVHPGYPEEIVANILPPATYNPPVFKAWFEIETPDGVRRRHAAEWELRRDQFALLKSEIAEELASSKPR